MRKQNRNVFVILLFLPFLKACLVLDAGPKACSVESEIGEKIIQGFQKASQYGEAIQKQREADLYACGVRKREGKPDVFYLSFLGKRQEEMQAWRHKICTCMQSKGYAYQELRGCLTDAPVVPSARKANFCE